MKIFDFFHHVEEASEHKFLCISDERPGYPPKTDSAKEAEMPRERERERD